MQDSRFLTPPATSLHHHQRKQYYNALNVLVEKRMSAGFNFLVNCTRSKDLESTGSSTMAFAQNGGTVFPVDSYNLRNERSYTPLDVLHVFVLSYERSTIQFCAGAFNLTNTPTFFLPNANNSALTIGNANCGRLTSSSATGRQIQFGLKVLF